MFVAHKPQAHLHEESYIDNHHIWEYIPKNIICQGKKENLIFF